MTIDRLRSRVLLWENPAYSCFLQNSFFSCMSLIIQLLIVSKRKSENANSGPLPCPCAGPPHTLSGPLILLCCRPKPPCPVVTTSGRDSGWWVSIPCVWLLQDKAPE